MSTIHALLSKTDLPAAEARSLLAYLFALHFQLPKSALISRAEMPLTQDFLAAWHDLEAKRSAGEPIAYLIGTRSFHQIELTVTAAVLIPRPETELLVDLALSEITLLREKKPNPVLQILDLGTGSGAIALAIAAALRGLNEHSNQVQFMATDASVEALAIAKLNTDRLNLAKSIQFLAGSWYQALPRDHFADTFDLILSNPPYIQAGDSHLQQGDLRFEPLGALSDGDDGLTCLREIINGASHFLRPQGLLAVEHGYDQLEAVLAIMAKAGLSAVQSYADLAGHPRVVSARK